MLYLSTRDKADSFTAYKALRTATPPDGGMFMPMQLPAQTDYELGRFERMNFGEAMASVINLFFGTSLTGWDVDFAVGRQAVDFVSIGHKVSVSESWHNPAGTHDYLLLRLYNLIIEDKMNRQMPNAWFCTVVDIAILFGIYGKYCRREIYEFDVAVPTDNMQLLLAVRYAQKMGLPIRKIIIGCTENDGIWDLLSYGEYTPVLKERNICFEALLWLNFGYSEVGKYLEAIEKKVAYRLNAVLMDGFRKDLFGTVVGDYRVKSVAESTIMTNRYHMNNDTARAFGALQNYRAKTGENKNTLLLAKNMPKHK